MAPADRSARRVPRYMFCHRHRHCGGMRAWCRRPKRQRKAAGPFIQLYCRRPEPVRASVARVRFRSDDKGKYMQLPAILQGDSLKRLLQGAAAGAAATLLIGFNWGGWVTGGTAKDMTQRSSTAAVIAALSPICVDKFQRSAEATANMTELKKVSSYQQ